MSVLLYLLLLASSAQDDLSRQVTAEVKAASAPIAIAELSRQVGYPLEAMPSTKDDYLIIRVEKAPLGTLMDRIAKVTNTSWEKRESGYRLIRTAENLRQEADQELAEFQTEVQAALDELKKQRSQELDLTEKSAEGIANQIFDWQDRQFNGGPASDWQVYARLQKSTPINRLLGSILPTLDAKTLATVPLDRRLVLSSSPNRMQRPLPASIAPLWRTFVREQELWNKAYKAVRERRQAQDRYYMGASGPLNDAATGKVIVGITRQADRAPLSIRLQAFDARGRLITAADESLGTSQFSNDFRAETAKLGTDESPLQFEGTSLKLNQAIQQAFKSAMQNNGQPDFQVDQELRSVLLQPEKYEPLSLLPSDALIGSAKAKRLNLVCSANDELFMGIGLGVPGELKPAQVLATLSALGSTVRVEDGWLTVAPKAPSYARKTRSNRLVLGQFYRRCDKEGRVSLDNQANYAFQSGLENESFMHMIVLMLTGILRAGNEYGSNWSGLRLFGSLTPPQRQAVRQGQPIPLRSFNPGQVEIIRHHLFDRPYSDFQITYTNEDHDLASEDNVFYGTLENEVTEVLPNGLTGTEVFRITDTSEPRFFGKPESDNPGGPRWGESTLTAQGIAFEVFQEERPEFLPWRSQPGMMRPPIKKFRMGIERTVSIQAQFTRRATLNMQLSDRQAQGEYVSLDKLPAEQRKLIQDELVRLRDQYKNMKPPEWNPGGGGQRPPPPF